jgi:hypothetical protein
MYKDLDQDVERQALKSGRKAAGGAVEYQARRE